MAAADSGQKDKLKISVCTVDDNGKVKVDKGKVFTFMLNPSEYDHSFAIVYNKQDAIGQSGSDARFSGVKPEKLKFTTLMDGTGAVAGPDAAKTDVKTQLEDLKAVIYNYDGEKHEHRDG